MKNNRKQTKMVEDILIVKFEKGECCWWFK